MKGDFETITLEDNVSWKNSPLRNEQLFAQSFW
jgi:hypothetical protein